MRPCCACALRKHTCISLGCFYCRGVCTHDNFTSPQRPQRLSLIVSLPLLISVALTGLMMVLLKWVGVFAFLEAFGSHNTKSNRVYIVTNIIKATFPANSIHLKQRYISQSIQLQQLAITHPY